MATASVNNVVAEFSIAHGIGYVGRLAAQAATGLYLAALDGAARVSAKGDDP